MFLETVVFALNYSFLGYYENALESDACILFVLGSGLSVSSSSFDGVL